MCRSVQRMRDGERDRENDREYEQEKERKGKPGVEVIYVVLYTK